MRILSLVSVWTALLGGWVTAAERLPVVSPADVGFDPAKLAQIDALVETGLQEKRMPGCVVLVGRHGKIAWLKAYGRRAIRPEVVPMTTDTVFDLASLTKPVAAATSVMLLKERGKFKFDDPVAQHLPAFSQGGKEQVTIQQLLVHQSGLIPDNALKDYLDGPEKSFERIFALKPKTPPGTKFTYSDVGFLVLGELVRQVSGQPVNEFSQDNIFKPLGMSETGYLPGEALRLRAAPTEARDGKFTPGVVHDPRAFHLGGVAGHAGLFSTAEDLAVYAQMLLGKGTYGAGEKAVQILRPETVEEMTRPVVVSSGLRGLGWDMQTGYSSNRGEGMSPAAFGHGGFTGTAIWIDPQLDLFVVFLSNRVHPDGKGLVNPLAGKIGSAVVQSIAP